MYLGRLVEVGPVERMLSEPRHPYTKALLSALPQIELPQIEPSGPSAADPMAGRPERILLPGEPTDPTRIPNGCRFNPRCPALASGQANAVADSCRTRSPDVLRDGALERDTPGSGADGNHEAACWLTP
jgi:peptide/nickel transport system ATP-binding protein